MKHLLGLYRNFFGFHEPYKVLIDGTFCKVSLQYNIQIKEQMKKYLNGETQFYTTRCVLTELELLGDSLYGAKVIAQRFKIHPCPHRKKPVSAQNCLKAILNDEDKFLLATQDFELTKEAKSIPGIPILYIHQNNIVLDKMSKATLQHVQDVSQGKVKPSQEQQSSIQDLKKDANILPEKLPKRKRKGPKGPNPLSCKKSKKSKSTNSDPQVLLRRRKRKRKRPGGKMQEV